MLRRPIPSGWLNPTDLALTLRSTYDPTPSLGQKRLGHTAKAVTERHYINPKLAVPDYRVATERIAPLQGAATGQLSGSESPAASTIGAGAQSLRSEPSTRSALRRRAQPRASTRFAISKREHSEP